MKKLLALALAIILLLVGIILAGCGENTKDRVSWSFDKSEGTLTISGTGSMLSVYDVSDSNYWAHVAPWYEFREEIKVVIIEDGITDIESNAFLHCSALTSITIPNSVTSIGTEAFGSCTSLTAITIPDSVINIYDKAFTNCTSLTSITIPESVTTIENGSFLGCTSLTSITIPEGVTTIENGSFWGCTSLTSITIPESVTTIYNTAFMGCSSLSTIIVPDGITCISEATFRNFKNLKYNEKDGVQYLGNSKNPYVAAISADTSLSSITLADSTICICSYAFANCSLLTSITIPDSVTSIGAGAFSGCESLVTITIPDNVTSIDSSAFKNCTNLKLAEKDGIKYLDTPNNPYLVLLEASSSLTSITVPDSVICIGDSAFYNCTSLSAITIPHRAATSIDSCAFRNCNDLKDVYYDGDKEQAISLFNLNPNDFFFRECWVNDSTIIHCTDGDITISEIKG